jgi:hypothetical protein
MLARPTQGTEGETITHTYVYVQAPPPPSLVVGVLVGSTIAYSLCQKEGIPIFPSVERETIIVATLPSCAVHVRSIEGFTTVASRTSAPRGNISPNFFPLYGRCMLAPD